MNKILRLILLFFLLDDYQCSASLESPTVEIPGLGTVLGSITYSTWTNQSILQFMGIPYAESPSKELRFKAPVPKSKWNGIHNGTKFGRPCPNRNYLDKLTAAEKLEDLEDCLNLCVYTKDLKKSSTVMVYIHGGAFSHGSAMEYMPNYLLEKDIVLVAIQYRLGALGFLSTRTKDIPGNMGVLDAILALQWIQKYIQHFGGNPKDITVFGESAGGCITSLLTVTPKVNKKLFKRAIIQSGSYLLPSIYQWQPIEEAKAACNLFKCKNCDSIDDINKCLQSASLEQLVNANKNKEVPYGFSEFDYDGVMPIEAEKLAKSQRNANEVMIGANRQDGAFLMNFEGLNYTPRQFLESIIKQFDESNFSGVMGSLFAKLFFTTEELNQSKINVKEMLPSFVDIASTITFKSPVQRYVELYSEDKKQNFKIYLYTFDYVGQFNLISSIRELQAKLPYFPIVNGTHHSDDLIYLFPPPADFKGISLNSADTEMAKTMVEMWTSFSISGIPKTKSINLAHIKTPNGPYFHINKEITMGNDFRNEFFVAKNTKINS